MPFCPLKAVCFTLKPNGSISIGIFTNTLLQNDHCIKEERETYGKEMS